jgi:hypothetical protein
MQTPMTCVLKQLLPMPVPPACLGISYDIPDILIAYFGLSRASVGGSIRRG